MRIRTGRTLLVGLALAVLLAGCATVARQDTLGVPSAENPEYLIHPFRLIALSTTLFANGLQYGCVEPFYFAMNAMPDAVGLSLDEQLYLKQRQDAWKKAFSNLQEKSAQ